MRTRVLTDEENKQYNERVAREFLDKPIRPPESSQEFFERISNQKLQPSPPMLLTIEHAMQMDADLRGRELTEEEKLAWVNKNREQWGFPPIDKMLPPHED